MKSFFEGKVLNMLPIPKGVVFAIATDITEDEKMEVEYRLLSLETNEIQRISNSVFSLAKFGPGHKAVERQVKNHLTSRACLIPGGEVFVLEDDCSAKLLDADGYAKWVGVVRYKGTAPSDVVYDGNNIWVSFPQYNALIRMNTTSMREELRVGGGKGIEGFNAPTSIFSEDDWLYVSNSKSMTVWRINVKTYAAEQYREFEEPVYGFCRVGNREIAHLESGIYEV